jgi:serine protease AprX
MKLFSLTIATLLAASWLLAGHPKISKDLDRVSTEDSVDVIIRYRAIPGDSQKQKLASKGGKEKLPLDAIRATAASVPASKLKELADDPDIVFITRDRVVKPSLDYAVPTVGGTFARSLGADGRGIGVAVIDSGIQETEDLRGRIVYRENFVEEDPRKPKDDRSARDDYGHGTHVAGVLAGDGQKSGGKFAGMAPKARLISLRVLSDSGEGRDSYVIAAIQRAIELKSKFNIRVMNLSLGRPIYESFRTDPLCLAVESAWKAGIVVVVAAGNEGRNNTAGNLGYGTILAPANDPYVITVGAMKTEGTLSRGDDSIASYSSKGPSVLDNIIKPDIVAPGNRMVSILSHRNALLAELFPANVVNKDYIRLSGTSVAAPMVSGAAALLLQKQPALTPDQVKARLMKTAVKSFPTTATITDGATGKVYTSYHDVFTVGAGYLDVVAALTSNDTPPLGLRAVSPIAVFHPDTNQVFALADPSAVCGDSAIWGTSVVWGTICGNSAIWGSSAVWGSSVVWGTSALWGTSAVWGSLVFPAVPNPPPPGSAEIVGLPIGSNLSALTRNVVWGSSVSPLSRGE